MWEPEYDCKWYWPTKHLVPGSMWTRSPRAFDRMLQPAAQWSCSPYHPSRRFSRRHLQVSLARCPVELQPFHVISTSECQWVFDLAIYFWAPRLFLELFHHKLDDSSQLMTIPKLEMLTMLACEHRGCGCMKTAAQVRLWQPLGGSSHLAMASYT